MPARPLLSVLKWGVALASLAGLLALAVLLHGRLGGERPAEGAGESSENPRRVQNNVIKLGARLAESYGLQDAPAEPARWHGRVTVYGRVVPNARATAEVRAPFAGTLRADPQGSWPQLGSRVKAGQVLAWLDVRVGPEVRLDLVTRLKEARAKRAGAEQVVKIQQDRVKRFESAGGSLARSDLDTARVQLTEARTQLAAAEATVRQWEDALAEIDRHGDRKGAAWSQPLKAPRAGEVTELAGTPGMVVEAGGRIARVVDFRRALVRLDIPLSALVSGPPRTVELSAEQPVEPALLGAGRPPEPAKRAPTVPAVLAGAAPQVDPTSQSAGFWYEVDTKAGAEGGAAADVVGVWRPGLFVAARLKTVGGKSRPAVAVRESALLYHQGWALVYVRIGPGRYERRGVQVLGREGNSWLLAGGVAAGERVVYRRAQVLLSEEFRGEADTE